MSRAFVPHIITDDSAAGGQLIDGSFKFEGAGSLSRTPTSIGNRKQFTFSYWMKHTNDKVQHFFQQRADSNGSQQYGISTRVLSSGVMDDIVLRVLAQESGNKLLLDSVATISDEGWYHIVVATDTTLGTNTERTKVYINNQRLTEWQSPVYFDQHYNTSINNTVRSLLGVQRPNSSSTLGNHFQGYMSQFYMVDGQALVPSDFGYTESQTGIWRPKKYVSKKINNGTTWSSNVTSSNIYAGAAADVFDGDPLDSVSINSSDASNNHITLSSVNVVASKVSVWVSNSSSDIQVYINGSLVGTVATGDMTSNVSKPFSFTFTETTVSTIKVQRVSSTSGWFIYAINLNDVMLIDGNTSNMGVNGFYFPFDGSDLVEIDKSGNNNHFTISGMKTSVTLDKATGALPIMETTSGGTLALSRVRDDALKSNVSFAAPLNGQFRDKSAIIKGSGTAKNLSVVGSIGMDDTIRNFYSSSAFLQNGNQQQITITGYGSDFVMTGEFCIEAWVYPTDSGTGDGSLFVQKYLAGYFAFNFDPGTRFNVYLNSGSPVWSPAGDAINAVVIGQWNHVALTRDSGNLLRLFVNGRCYATYSHSGSLGYAEASDEFTRIGGGANPSIDSYIQDVRVYKGVAKYTSSFLIPSQEPTVLPESPAGIAVPRKFRPNVNGACAFDGLGNSTVQEAALSIADSSDFYATGDWTLECWVLRNKLPAQSAGIIGQWVSGGGTDRNIQIYMNTDGTIKGYQNRSATNYEAGSVSAIKKGEWTHIALVLQGTTIRFYTNGKQTQSNSVSGSANNATKPFFIGSEGNSSSQSIYSFDGLISNARFVNGTAVYPDGTEFTPPTEPLTAITNTKLLCCQSKDSSTTAAVTPSALSTHGNVRATDVNPYDIGDVHPQESSYCVMNENFRYYPALLGGGSDSVTVSDGGLTSTASVDNKEIIGNLGASSGKFYYEAECQDTGPSSNDGIGWACLDGFGVNGTTAGGYTMFLRNRGGTVVGNSNSRTDGALGSHEIFVKGDTIGCAIDLDNRIAYWYKNGVRSSFSHDFSSASGGTMVGKPFVPFALHRATGSFKYNFGQKPFRFRPPEGYQTLNTNNIQHSILPKKHFGIVLYTGDNTTSRDISGLQFQPDFVWIKPRSSVSNHCVLDSVRGVHNRIITNSTGANVNNAATIQAFNVDGFRIGNSSLLNTNGETHVAWCWKAGGNSNTFNVDGVGYATQAAAGIHAGNLSLTGASVNTKAGFSILTWTGDGNASANVGTGFSSDKPLSWAIVKKTSTSSDWQVGHSGSGQGRNFAYHYNLNDASDLDGSSPYHMGSQSATNGDRLYLAGDGAANTVSYVAYVWKEIDGYSKFGYYQGNGDDFDGPFQYTGFRPALVIYKCSSDDNRNWRMMDSTRDTENRTGKQLFPNLSNAESDYTTGGVEYFSNGFKMRNNSSQYNTSGTTYIYMAFAEFPLGTPFGVSANAR